ncbi:MAG: DUF4416 family protein [Candidatus Omnitrophota bacterium]
MGRTSKVKPVKLIAGFIYLDEEVFKKSKDILEKKYGRIDFESQILPFDLTDYYAEEFGKNLKRSFVSFFKLISPSNLYKIKSFTNALESKLSFKGKRRVNIDPGYLDLAKVVLATTKDYAHRIYLNKGIFAEASLYFKGGSFIPSQWSYPDFKKCEYIDIFNSIRELYHKQT